MKKIVDWVGTIFFLPPFVLSFVVFHLVIFSAHKLFGYRGIKHSIDYLQITVITILKIFGGASLKVRKNDKLPVPLTRPVIFVSNHQSIYDIPFLFWYCRKYHPKFVAKKELGKGIPSTSYYLRHGDNILIDRKDKNQALRAIQGLGEYIEKHRRSAVIYPEGSRSKDGILKPFKYSGLLKLMEAAPSACIVPIVIENSWKIVRHSFLPLPFGIRCKITFLDPIEPGEYSQKETIKIAEEKMRKFLGQEKIRKQSTLAKK